MTPLEEQRAKEALFAELRLMCNEILCVSTDPEGMVRVWLEQLQNWKHTVAMEGAIRARHAHFFEEPKETE